MAILSMLTLPIHEHGVSLRIFVLSSISLIDILQFAKYAYPTAQTVPDPS